MKANSISESRYVLRFLNGSLNFYIPPAFLTAKDMSSELAASLNNYFMHFIFGLSRNPRSRMSILFATGCSFTVTALLE